VAFIGSALLSELACLLGFAEVGEHSREVAGRMERPWIVFPGQPPQAIQVIAGTLPVSKL
jgi:hypothetical protein